MKPKSKSKSNVVSDDEINSNDTIHTCASTSSTNGMDIGTKPTTSNRLTRETNSSSSDRSSNVNTSTLHQAMSNSHELVEQTVFPRTKLPSQVYTNEQLVFDQSSTMPNRDESYYQPWKNVYTGMIPNAFDPYANNQSNSVSNTTSSRRINEYVPSLKPIVPNK